MRSRTARSVHHAPPNASAGSTPTARRSPARLASVPTTTATTSRTEVRRRRSSTRNGNERHERLRQHRGDERAARATARSPAAAARRTACAFDAPVAFRTAKSRTRSSADRYTIEPMIPAATIQSRTLIEVDGRLAALARMRGDRGDVVVGEHAQAAERTAGRRCMMTALASVLPANARSWAVVQREVHGVDAEVVADCRRCSRRRVREAAHVEAVADAHVEVVVDHDLAVGSCRTALGDLGGAEALARLVAEQVHVVQRTRRRWCRAPTMIGAAARTPSASDTPLVVSALRNFVVVNGPEAPRATAHESRP